MQQIAHVTTVLPTYLQPHADNTLIYKALDQCQISDFITQVYRTTKLQYATARVRNTSH